MGHQEVNSVLFFPEEEEREKRMKEEEEREDFKKTENGSRM